MSTHTTTGEGGQKKATLRDIAVEAGVSVPTVSKVVKGRKDVSPATRARVQELLLHYGYRSPAGGGSRGALELYFDSMSSTNNLSILDGVLRAADTAGLDVVVKLTPMGVNERRWVEMVTDAQHSGLILVTSKLDSAQQDAFARAGLPVVVIDPVNTPRRPLPSIGVNNFNGAFEATQHLITLGHRDIAIIEGISSECAQARLAGYHSALHAAGIPVEPTYQRSGGFRYEEGRAAAHELLTLPHPPSAIFATNDLEALGVLDAARALGVDVPGELSVVGFDDAIQAVSAAPRLTTVRQPFAEIGSTAVQVLVQLMSGTSLATHRLELATELVVRESTSSPAPRRR